MDVQDVIKNSSAAVADTTSRESLDDTRTQFLTLLMTQLQNQDPLSPMDTDQMTAQMMSMGQLEQLFNLNEKVGDLVDITSTSQIANFSGMVGKNALSKGNVLQVEGVSKGTVFFELDTVPDSTVIKVFNKYGSEVSQINPSISNTGLQSVNFDGLNLQGDPVDDGYYTYTIEALSTEGNALPVETYAAGRISSIRIESGVPVFEMGDNELKAKDIERVF